MDFIQQLQVFVAVAESGSFTRAAQALRMTRPAVTNAINTLESALSVRLLHRTTRRSSLTNEGELLLSRAGALLADITETRNLFGDPDGRPRGTLRVDIAVALAKSLVVPALPGFRASCPDVDLVLGVSDQPVDLVADAVDCVLRIGSIQESSMVARKLATIRMVLCASPEYLAAKGVPKGAGDLAGHEAVHYFSGKNHRPVDWSLGVEADRISSSIIVNDAEALIGCALAGMGLVQVPGIFVEEHFSSGRLVQVLPEVAEVEWPVYIMYPNRQFLASRVRAFIDWMVETVASRESPWIRPI